MHSRFSGWVQDTGANVTGRHVTRGEVLAQLINLDLAPAQQEFLAAIRDPRHPEHKDQLAWAGGKFDPEAFDLAAVNRRLRTLR